MTGLLSVLRKAKLPALLRWAQPALSAGAGLFSASLPQDSSFIPFLAACTRCSIPAELTPPSLGQCWCCLRWAAQGSLGLGQPRTCRPKSRVPWSWRFHLPLALESPSVSAISPGSQTFWFPNFFLQLCVSNPSFSPNSGFSPQWLEFLRLSCLLFLLGSLVLADECKTWVINCQ